MAPTKAATQLNNITATTVATKKRSNANSKVIEEESPSTSLYPNIYHIPQDVAIWIITNIVILKQPDIMSNFICEKIFQVPTTTKDHHHQFISPTAAEYWTISKFPFARPLQSMISHIEPTSLELLPLRNYLIENLSNPILFPKGLRGFKVPALRLIGSLLCNACKTTTTNHTKPFIMKITLPEEPDDMSDMVIELLGKEAMMVNITGYRDYNKSDLIQSIVGNCYSDYPNNTQVHTKFCKHIFSVEKYKISSSLQQEIQTSLLSTAATRNNTTSSTTTTTTTTTTNNHTKTKKKVKTSHPEPRNPSITGLPPNVTSISQEEDPVSDGLQ